MLDDARALGFTATEAGPPGFLPSDPAAAKALLASRGIRLVGGFVTGVLHVSVRRAAALAELARQARWLAVAGADVLVLAAASQGQGYDTRDRLDDAAWSALLDGIARVREIATRQGLAVALHPHFGTVIERAAEVERLLASSDVDLCLDTGHLTLGGCDPASLVAQVPARIRHVHLKDVRADIAAAVAAGTVQYGEGVRRGLYVPLGEGSARIAGVLKALARAEYAGWYVFEQDVMLTRPPHGPPSWIRASLDFVKASDA